MGDLSSQNLRGDTGIHGRSPKRHLDSDTVAVYVDGDLSEEQARSADEHLAECDECVEKIDRARGAAFLIEHWTAQEHGAAYARSQQPERRDRSWGPALRATIADWLHPPLPIQGLVIGEAAAPKLPPADKPLARVPALVGDEQGARDTWIEVVQAPAIGRRGSLVIGLRIPRDLGEAAQKLELWLLSVSDREPIGDPVKVSPGGQYTATFQLPDELRDRWRDLEEMEPASWPFRFALRPQQP